MGLFKKNANNRPEGTTVTDQGIVHYTCNSPDKETLGKKGIRGIGGGFNVSQDEVLLIPENELKKHGYTPDSTGVEAYLREISRR